MTPTKIDNVLSWASDVDPETLLQAGKTSRLPILAGPVALMPDAHVGIGATVGSVVATAGAIIPAAVGVDIGCGMVASQTTLTAEDLPDDLTGLHSAIRRSVPAGLGRSHGVVHRQADRWMEAHEAHTDRVRDHATTAAEQFGTLGSGNHFVEVCLDEGTRVWAVLHSGSRGVGNKLGTAHIKEARLLARNMELSLEDPDLAYFFQGTQEFDEYITDMLWAQDYALANRDAMMSAVIAALFSACGRKGVVQFTVNCHHNYAALENHLGRVVWVTRKGAVRAGLGEWGIIPGSMATGTYIVRGLGNPASYTSCSHGAGRRMSRTRAKKELSVESLRTAMTGKAWNADEAVQLLDEHPAAYKDIDQVMDDQADLVEVVYTLRQVLNYKGTDDHRHR